MKVFKKIEGKWIPEDINDLELNNFSKEELIKLIKALAEENQKLMEARTELKRKNIGLKKTVENFYEKQERMLGNYKGSKYD